MSSGGVKKTLKKRLSTGQTIHLSPQDERMLRLAYDHMQGHCRRQQIESTVEKKREEVASKAALIPASAKHFTTSRLSSTQTPSLKNFRADSRSEVEIAVDEYHKVKDELAVLEEKLSAYLAVDHKISLKDIESTMKKLGIVIPKRVLEHMMWEVDEMADEVICWDEFQLTYHRNITDTTGSEPSSFFRLLEFLTFDQQKKGYIIEDDCMEILFARFGSSKLEKELQAIFGSKLRAAGGDGTLNLEGYLAACLVRTGRRALVT